MMHRIRTMMLVYYLAAFVAAVGGPPLAASQGQGQQVAVAVRGPRFLLAPTSSKAVPVEIDVHRNTLLRQVVSLNFERPSVGQVLAAIERQTGLKFFYSHETLSADRPVRLRADSITVAAALMAILVDTGVDVLLSPGTQIALVRRGEVGRLWQQGSLVGRVTDTAGRGVSEADVFLDGTRWRTRTDSGGWYRLVEVDSGTYTLTARRLGYAKRSRGVTVRENQTDTVDVVMRPATTRLQDLVTTATGQRRRLDIVNDVTTINADSVMQAAPIRSVTDLLDTRVPGLTVQRTSGAPGDPARLRLRGVGSALRNNDPVVIVDGVRIYAEQSANRGGNLARRQVDSSRSQGSDAAPSPIDYLDPNTISKIEILKGPSAATLYGQDAANGVIVITTKRGRQGPTRWAAHLAHGWTRMEGEYPTLHVRWGRNVFNNNLVNCGPTNIGPDNVICRTDSVSAFQLLNDPALTVLGRGHRMSGSVTASGGTSALTYAVTGSYQDELGLLKLPDYEVDRYQTTLGVPAPDWMRRPQHLTQWGVTSNIEARLGAKTGLTFTAGLSRTRQQKSSLQDQLGAMMTTYLDRSGGLYYRFPVDVVAGSHVVGAPIAAYYKRITDVATQFTNGLSLNYQPWAWAAVIANAGLQVAHRVDQLFIPRGPNASEADPLIGGDTLGSVSDGQGNSVVRTVNVRGHVLRPLGRGFQFRFALGANYTGTTIHDLAGRTNDLLPGTSLKGQTLVFLEPNELSDATFGWYAEPSVGNSKLNVTAGLRLDGGKAYGANVGGLRLPKFPKLGFSYLVSDEPWFPFPKTVQSFRIRVAYGQASRQPGPKDKLRLYGIPTPVVADGVTGTGLVLASLGNTEVRPERTAELEGGFDADVWNSRVTLSVSGFRKTTEDALLHVPVAPEILGLGWSLTKNIGVIRNTGLEVTTSAQLVRSEPVTWTVALNLSRFRNMVVKLGTGVQPFYTTGAFNNTAGDDIEGGVRIAAGYPLFGRWSRPITGYADANGNGVLEAQEVQLGDTAVYVGAPLPNYTLGLFSTVSLWRGAVIVDAALQHEDGLGQQNQLASNLGRFSTAQQVPGASLAEQLATIDLRRNNGLAVTDYNWVQTVSTTRFTALSVRYMLPATVARRVGAERLSVAVQGANLGLWTNYRGLDPNVNAFGTGNSVADTGILPQPRTWQLQVNATY